MCILERWSYVVSCLFHSPTDTSLQAFLTPNAVHGLSTTLVALPINQLAPHEPSVLGPVPQFGLTPDVSRHAAQAFTSVSTKGLGHRHGSVPEHVAKWTDYCSKTTRPTVPLHATWQTDVRLYPFPLLRYHHTDLKYPVGNTARAFRVTELLRDYQDVQRKIAAYDATPSEAAFNEIGYVTLRQCHAEAYALLNAPYPVELLHPPTGPGEDEKRQLQRSLLARSSYPIPGPKDHYSDVV